MHYKRNLVSSSQSPNTVLSEAQTSSVSDSPGILIVKFRKKKFITIYNKREQLRPPVCFLFLWHDMHNPACSASLPSNEKKEI